MSLSYTRERPGALWHQVVLFAACESTPCYFWLYSLPLYLTQQLDLTTVLITETADSLTSAAQAARLRTRFAAGPVARGVVIAAVPRFVAVSIVALLD